MSCLCSCAFQRSMARIRLREDLFFTGTQGDTAIQGCSPPRLKWCKEGRRLHHSCLSGHYNDMRVLWKCNVMLCDQVRFKLHHRSANTAEIRRQPNETVEAVPFIVCMHSSALPSKSGREAVQSENRSSEKNGLPAVSVHFADRVSN